jgi:ribosome-associated protein
MYDTHDEDYESFENVERLNRSQQKREIQMLLALGKNLSRLDEIALGKMELPQELFQALLDVQAMKHGAEKRQFKLICKMLRQINTESLQETIDNLEHKKADQDKNFHRIEYWRDRLIEEGQTAMTEFMAKYPQADAGQIRQLIRNANKELTANKPPKSSKALFRYLRTIIFQSEVN